MASHRDRMLDRMFPNRIHTSFGGQHAIHFLAAIVDSSNDAIVGKDLDGTIVSWNAAAEALYGYPAAEMVGHHISRIVPEDKRDELQQIIARIRRDEKVSNLETIRVNRAGERIPISITISPIKDETGRVIGASAISRNISESRKRQEALEALNQRLEALSFRDELTGLLNRRGLERSLAEQAGNSQERIAILIDCNGFKTINDDYGYTAGDAVLRDLAEKLRLYTRDGDTLARVGGDEMLAVLPGASHREAATIAQRLDRALTKQSFHHRGVTIDYSVSMAMARLPNGTTRVATVLGATQDILKRAHARHHLKTGGSATAHDLSWLDQAQSDFDLDPIHVVQAPIFNLVTGQVVAWKLYAAPLDGGDDGPETLFRGMHEQGLLARVDVDSFETCCRAAGNLKEPAQIKILPTTLETLSEPHFQQRLRMAAKMSVTLDLSEHWMVDDVVTLAARLKPLRDAGLRIALDDAGYRSSCLETIVLLRPDLVKIDAHWITGVHKDRRRSDVVARLVRYTRTLGIDLLAEGVETSGEAEWLCEHGVQLVEGPYASQLEAIPTE